MKRSKSILENLKKYWYLFVIFGLTGLVLLASFMGEARAAQLVKTLKDSAENYKKRVDLIENLSEQKSDKDKKALKVYEENNKEIEEKKKKQVKKVNKTKLKLVEKLKEESTDELAKKMKEEFKL